MSIFENVVAVPPDPIFGLEARFKKDKNPNKVDLTVGIYRGEDLKTQVLRSVKEGEKILFNVEKDKAYLPMGGDEQFVLESQKLLFGEQFCKDARGTLFGIQSVGGTGALKLAGGVLAQEVTKVIYVSDPTWPNHIGIFEGCGMEIKKYPYYDGENHRLTFERMLDTLSKAPEKSLVLLHACCHNPTGCDPSQAEWKELSMLMQKKKLIPIFDCAYQGFGKGLEEDVWAIRYFASQGHEMFVAASCSKNFGLYGERTGSLSVISKNEQLTRNLSTVIKYFGRVNYSTPPRHGSGIVTVILQDLGLTEMWKGEVEHMRLRIEQKRNELYNALTKQFGKDRFSFLKRRQGLFSMLGIPSKQVDRMIDEFGIYLTRGSRVNLSGLSEKNLPYVIEAIVKTME
ncbi:MAG: aspartate/tyrosine/aromatic aminotransferase [Chlamydiia bacterium]|nr:aspartate/tyrosine/aromatic aminotransferase [Chlamydiia bacterium]